MDLKKSKNLSKSSISVLKMESRIRLQGLPFTTHKVAIFSAIIHVFLVTII